MKTENSSLEIIEKLFPFGFCVNSRGDLVSIFKSFQKYFPNCKVGDSLWDYLEPTEHNQAQFPKIERKLAIYKDKESNVKFKGQFILLDNVFVFAGSLQVHSMKELISKKLSFNDFSVQDPLFDFIMLISAERASNIELNQTLKSLEFKNRLDKHLQDISVQLSYCSSLENGIKIVNNQLTEVFRTAECSLVKNIEVIKKILNVDMKSEFSSWYIQDKLAYYCVTVYRSEFDQEYLLFRVADIKEEVESIKAFLVVLGQLILGVVERDLRQEQARQHFAKMAHSEKLVTLGEISASIGHEINNPLAVIKTAARSIKRNAAINDQKSLDNLATIDTMVERITKIIKGLKTFSRDGAKDPFEAVDIRSIIQDSIPLVQSKLDVNRVNFSIHLPTEKIFAKCRSVQISQIVVNLINNAIDAIETNEQKWIKLEAFLIPDDMLRIQIVDSGKGISPENLKRVMTPFFTTKDPGKGTGLGLSISMGILREHGGQLAVDQNQPNTCFYFTLPLAHSRSVAS